MLNDQKEWRNEETDYQQKMKMLKQKGKVKKPGDKNFKDRDQTDIPFFEGIKDKGHFLDGNDDYPQKTQAFIEKLDKVGVPTQMADPTIQNLLSGIIFFWLKL